jgi:hypothetical protein
VISSIKKGSDIPRFAIDVDGDGSFKEDDLDAINMQDLVSVKSKQLEMERLENEKKENERKDKEKKEKVRRGKNQRSPAGRSPPPISPAADTPSKSDRYKPVVT